MVIGNVKGLVGIMVDETKKVVSVNRYGGHALFAQMDEYKNEIKDLLKKIEKLEDSDLGVGDVGSDFKALSGFYAVRDSSVDGYTAGQTAYKSLHDALTEKKKELSRNKQSAEGATSNSSGNGVIGAAGTDANTDSSSAGAAELSAERTGANTDSSSEGAGGDGADASANAAPSSKEKIEGIDALLKILDYFMQTKSETDKLVKYAEKIEEAGFFGKLTGHDTSVSKAFKVALAAIAMGAASMYTAGVVATALAAFSASAVVYSSLRVMSTYDVARRNNISIMKVKESALRYSTGKVELATAVLTTAAGALFPLFGVARVLSAAALAVRLPLSIAVSFVQSGRDFLKVNKKTPEGGSYAEYVAEAAVTAEKVASVPVSAAQLKLVISTLKKQCPDFKLSPEGSECPLGKITDVSTDDVFKGIASEIIKIDLTQQQSMDDKTKKSVSVCKTSLEELYKGACAQDKYAEVQGNESDKLFDGLKSAYGLTTSE